MGIKMNTILNGDCIEIMKTIPNECIDCIITSPPYWGLRDYGVEGQIGLEPTLDEYHLKLLEVTAECKRALKKTGTMFWVHGDSYGGSGQGAQTGYGDYKRKKVNDTMEKAVSLSATPKCLTMQNYRLAMRMIDEQGWTLRNILIWHKNNHMPSSVQDRFTNAYEQVFFFTKSKKYWFDLDAIRVPHTSNALERTLNPKDKFGKSPDSFGNGEKAHSAMGANMAGKNPGDVFTLNAQPFMGAHFAVFPEKLIEPFVKAGCPREVCKHCGFIQERITELGKVQCSGGGYVLGKGNPNKLTKGKIKTKMVQREHITKGWTSCTCEDKNKYEPGIVLDPFLGAGTTAVVAKKLGRNYIGIELNPEYIKIAQKRISAIPQRLDSYNVL